VCRHDIILCKIFYVVHNSNSGVFPFALKQSIDLCASLVKGTGLIIAFSSLMSGEGNPISVNVSSRFPELQSSLKATSWTDFLLCGVYSRILLGKAKGRETSDFCFPDDKDLLVYIDSRIPPAAGLSSSSALVVAMSLAVCKLLPPSEPYESLEFVSSCIEAERLIGTLGGGMDQTAR
jgi:galactokinase